MSQVAGLGVTKARSVVTIGAFTAVYFVLIWCSGMLGFFGPAFMFVGGVVSLLLNGSVVMLMLVRSRMFGTLTIMGGCRRRPHGSHRPRLGHPTGCRRSRFPGRSHRTGRRLRVCAP